MSPNVNILSMTARKVLCCFELVESIADATIIFALFPNVDSLYSKTVNEYGDTTISHVFCDLSKSESKDSKIYFLLYGDWSA